MALALASTALSDTDYDIYFGTSMAAPNVTGTSLLLLEHYVNEFAAWPFSATQKGILIHTATDAGNTGPDYTYGWGLVDAADAAEFITAAAEDSGEHRIYESHYSGDEWTQTFVSDGSGPLKATIAQPEY